MELRSDSHINFINASHIHFINAIRFGRVEKVRNVDSRGRPSLKFKALKDIYEDVNRQPNLSAWEHRYKNMAVDSGKRKTRKRDIDSVNIGKKSRNDDDGSDSDGSNFDELTLTQLKEQSKSKSKKRKVLHFDSVTVKQEYVDLQPEDETDLSKAIISWKSKVSKESKGKKKIPKKYAPILNPVKSEPILINEDSLQSDVVGLPSAVEVGVSVSECSESEPTVMISEACDSSVICGGEVHMETTEDVENELQSDSQLSLLKENEDCVLNDVNYDYMVHNEDDAVVDNPVMSFPQLTNAPYSEDEANSNRDSNPGEVFPEADLPSWEQGSDLYTNDPVLEISKQMPRKVIDDCASDLCELNDFVCQKTSLSSPSKNSSSSLVSAKCSNNDVVCGKDDLFSSHQTPVTLVGDDVETEYGQSNSPVDLPMVSAATEEEQHLRSPSNDRNQHCDSGDGISVPDMENHNLMETCHPPERLLSTRKVISPTSQERLCQAMKVEDMIEDVIDYKCKGKLHFEDATENKPQTKGKSAENAKVDVHLQDVGAVVNGSKVTTSPKRATITKISPPKANQKSSNHSRSLPSFSTGTRSLKKCSESAIAFSQMQMHDFENVATKLMNELNSMKEIVEGKLLRKTSPDVEVMMAVKRAKKTEETTKKWLSMMTRDCHRFCTIMKEPENSEVASSDESKTHKERRKITFADEVGGVLCQVKLFDDGMVP